MNGQGDPALQSLMVPSLLCLLTFPQKKQRAGGVSGTATFAYSPADAGGAGMVGQTTVYRCAKTRGAIASTTVSIAAKGIFMRVPPHAAVADRPAVRLQGNGHPFARGRRDAGRRHARADVRRTLAKMRQQRLLRAWPSQWPRSYTRVYPTLTRIRAAGAPAATARSTRRCWRGSTRRAFRRPTCPGRWISPAPDRPPPSRGCRKAPCCATFAVRSGSGREAARCTLRGRTG